MIISKKSKSKLIICLVIGSIIMGFYYLYLITSPSNKYTISLSDSRYFIAHATGSLAGYTYLNCREALINSLENGYKYIEVDLQYTSDSALVCVHDWEQFNKMTIPGISGSDSDEFTRIPTLNEFKARKIYSKYTPISLQDVISIQEKNNHLFTIVTDITSDANALNKYFIKEQRSHVMVEAFTKKDYKLLKEQGYIPMLSLGCLSLFNGGINFIISQIINPDCEWITVEQHCSKRTIRLLKKLFGTKIAVHTVNSEAYFRWYLGKEFDLIYTDNWNLQTQLNNYQDNTTR